MQQTLDTGQDRRNIVSRAPAVLENVQAELAIRVDIRVEHFAEEFHSRGLVGIGLVKRKEQLERAVLKRRIRCG